MLKLESDQARVTGRDVGAAWVFATLVLGALFFSSPSADSRLGIVKESAASPAARPDLTVVVQSERSSCTT